MKAIRIAIYDETDRFWGYLADTYQSIGLDNMVAVARNEFPDEFVQDDDLDFADYEEEIEGMVQGETDDYILTWEDAICQTVRIYKKTA